MKQLDNLSITELEAIANDGSVRIPEGFKDSICRDLDTLAFLSGAEVRRPRRLLYVAGVAASLVLLAGIGFGIDSYRTRPKDTFTDPAQAYAMLEQSFSFISSQMDKGVASLTKGTEEVLAKTSEIMDKVN